MNKYTALDLLKGETNLHEFFETVYSNLINAADKNGTLASMHNIIATVLYNGLKTVYDNPENIEYVSTMFHTALLDDNPLDDNPAYIGDFLPRLCGMLSNVCSIDGTPEKYERYTFFDFCFICWVICSSLIPVYYGEDDGDEPTPTTIRVESERIWHKICSF